MAAYRYRPRIFLLDPSNNVVLTISSGPLTCCVMGTLMAQELSEMQEYTGLSYSYMVKPVLPRKSYMSA